MQNFHAEQNFHAGQGSSNFHAGGGNFHAGTELQAKHNFHAGENFHAGDNNFHAGDGNFHAGADTDNFHAGDANFHAGSKPQVGQNCHAGDNNFHTGRSTKNFHAGDRNFHAGADNFHSGENFHAGRNFHAGNENFHAGADNFHTGGNFHAGRNFHAGIDNFHDGENNFHAGRAHENFQAGDGRNFHAGENFHAGDGLQLEQNFHAGDGENFHAGQAEQNFHAGKNFHAGQDNSFHAGSKNFHGGENSHAGDNFHAGENFHAGQENSFRAGNENFHRENFHAGQKVTSSTNFHCGNFHSGQDSHTNAQNFHAGQDKAVPSGNFHSGNLSVNQSFHAGVNNFHSGNFHSGREGNVLDSQNFHSGVTNFHSGRNDSFHAGIDNFHQGDTDADTKETNWHKGETHQAYLKYVGNTVDLAEIPIINTTARFFTRCSTAETPFNFVQRPVDGRFNNLQSEVGHIQVQDIAKQQAKFDLSVHGFSCVPQAFGSIEGRYTYTKPSVVESDFYPEIRALLLREIPSATKVVIFDHTVRVKGGERGPVTQVHIDQTPASARARVWRHLPPSAANKVMTEDTRFRIINVWIPINGKVESNPLAVVDSRTLVDGDLVAVEHRYPDWTGETYVVKKNEQQKWYVWGGMSDGDALLFCCYDSAGTGARCAHAAIKDPREVEGAKFRESIEIRALVFD